MSYDLISRQAAITLPVMPKEYREYQTNNLDDAYEQGWFDLQECIEELPSAQPEQQWIPCSERLPEPRLRVLATDGNFVGEAYMSKTEDWYRSGIPWTVAWKDWMKENTTVSHWMPLPEPPKGEQE